LAWSFFFFSLSLFLSLVLIDDLEFLDTLALFKVSDDILRCFQRTSNKWGEVWIEGKDDTTCFGIAKCKRRMETVCMEDA
jgi:hypothetical protein